MSTISDFIQAIKHFSKYECSSDSPYIRAVEAGQTAKIMVIGCSDSLVDPLSLMQAQLGELFVHRNIAGLVPPYKEGEQKDYHATSAALEYGVACLKVKDLIVLGHGYCGGITAMLKEEFPDLPQSFLKSWMQIVSEARTKVLDTHPNASFVEQRKLCEKESIKISLKNLMGYPWVAERVHKGLLHLHGWHFDRGELTVHHPSSNTFE